MEHIQNYERTRRKIWVRSMSERYGRNSTNSIVIFISRYILVKSDNIMINVKYYLIGVNLIARNYSKVFSETKF